MQFFEYVITGKIAQLHLLQGVKLLIFCSYGKLYIMVIKYLEFDSVRALCLEI